MAAKVAKAAKSPVKVTVWQTRTGTWSWATTDPGARVKADPRGSSYAYRRTARRGAQRAWGRLGRSVTFVEVQ